MPNHIEILERDNKIYEVQLGYWNQDSHDDKPTFVEPDVWIIHVPATSAITAIQTAMHVVQITKAETMTSFMPPKEILEDADNVTFTIDEIEAIRQAAEDNGIFKAWLDMEPTSIQCALMEDIDKLKDMTIVNLQGAVENVGNEAEEYLKEVDKNDT